MRVFEWVRARREACTPLRADKPSATDEWRRPPACGDGTTFGRKRCRTSPGSGRSKSSTGWWRSGDRQRRFGRQSSATSDLRPKYCSVIIISCRTNCIIRIFLLIFNFVFDFFNSFKFFNFMIKTKILIDFEFLKFHYFSFNNFHFHFSFSFF